MKSLYNDSLKYQIALTLIKGVGPIIGRQLTQFFGDEEALFRESPSALNKIPGMRPAIVNQIHSAAIKERADKEVLFCEKNHVIPLHFQHNDYPQRLLNCDDAPTLLFKKGTMNLNGPRVISIVGTRNVTEEGKTNCETFIDELHSKYPNVQVVSGLAYGVDICAHRACLRKDVETAAVVGHGLDRIYPFVHQNTALEMVHKGAIVSEFLSETEPERQNFVKRNRIIAGMADATVVIESAIKGGALITARIAASYNRDVLAFPGRKSDEYSGGCNWLIKNNIAALIESADDLGNCLGWESAMKGKEAIQTKLFHEFKSDEEQTIYQLFIKERQININQLRVMTDLPISKLSPILLNFEFDGLIKSLPGNNYKLI